MTNAVQHTGSIYSFSWQGRLLSTSLTQKHLHFCVATLSAHPLLVWWHSRTSLISNVAPLVWTVWNNFAATLETSASRLNGESLNHLLVAQTCCSVLVKCTTRPPSANGHLKIATRTRCASPFLRSKASDEDSPSAPLTQCPEAGSVLGRRGRAEGNGPRTNSGRPAAALHS